MAYFQGLVTRTSFRKVFIRIYSYDFCANFYMGYLCGIEHVDYLFMEFFGVILFVCLIFFTHFLFF